MELFHQKTKFDFMGKKKWSAAFSLSMLIVSLIILMSKGLDYGLDFTGGVQVELRFAQTISSDEIRNHLIEEGFSDAKVTYYGSQKDLLIRLRNQSDMNHDKIAATVKSALNKVGYQDIETRRVEFIGSEVGEQLTQQGFLAVIAAIGATMIYIAMRFEYRFAVSAALALLHDPILILGIFSLFQIDFDLSVLAAMLAVIGYSLNDTIVVYDRIRGNFRKHRRVSTEEIVNLSLNETLSRTIITSFLTLLVVVALCLFGGESLFGFSLALLIGIVIGTYSSIYVAGAFAVFLGLSEKDLAVVSKKEVDAMP